eukprot:8726075-Alexandrium_andersonii.AAC.1
MPLSSSPEVSPSSSDSLASAAPASGASGCSSIKPAAAAQASVARLAASKARAKAAARLSKPIARSSPKSSSCKRATVSPCRRKGAVDATGAVAARRCPAGSMASRSRKNV